MSDRTIVRRVTETRVIVRQGDTPAKVIVRNMGPPGLAGDDGPSAYAVAVANGFVGSEAAWLASLVGTDGTDGTDGADGDPGAAGPGVAAGGTAGQFLRKQSGTNYDTVWAAPAISEVTGLQAALDAIPSGEGGEMLIGTGLPGADLGNFGALYLDRLTGNFYRKWAKPLAWAWSAGDLSAEAQAALADCVLLVPMWDGSGDPIDLISGLTLPKDAGVTWATRDDMPCLDFDGQSSGITLPAPLLNASDPIFWVVAVYRLETSGFLEPQFHAFYGEVGDPDGGNPGSYRALYAVTDVPGYSGLFVDRYRINGADIDANSAGALTDVVKDGAFHAAVGVSTGQLTEPRLFLDGADVFSPDTWNHFVSGTPPSGETVLARIGTFANDYWSPGDAYSLLGSLAFLAVGTGALTAEQSAALSVDPFALIREAGDESGNWGLVGNLFDAAPDAPPGASWSAIRAKTAALYPLDEGAGAPTDQLTGDAGTLGSAPTWVTVEGITGLDFPDADGTESVVSVAPVLGGFPASCAFLVAYRKTVAPATSEHHRIYPETRGPDFTRLAFVNDADVQKVQLCLHAENDATAGADWKEWLLNGLLPDNAFDGELHTLVFVKSGNAGFILFDGVDISDGVPEVPVAGDAFTAAAPDAATISQATNSSLRGQLFGLGLMNAALTRAEAALISAVPFAFLRPPVSASASQAALTAVEDAGIAADAALDTRVDALELAPPAHVHPESEVTNLVTDLAAKAPLASPTFTGTPAAPTAAPGTNTTQLATMAALQAAIAALLNSAPGALDTLDELAAALGDDANFAATITTALAGKQPIHANLTAIAALVGASDRLAYFTGVGTLSLATFTTFGRSLAALADASALRTLAVLVPGTDVQTFHANLSAFAGLTLIADRLPYANGSGTLALATFTSFGRTLAALADAAAGRTALAVVPGTDVQAFSSILAALVAFTSISDGQTVKRVGSAYVGYTPGAGGLSDGDYGDITVSGTGTVLSVDNDAITNAKLANMATATVKGRSTAGTGDPEDLTLGANLAVAGGALYAGAAWAVQGMTTGLYYTASHATTAATTWANGRFIVAAICLAKTCSVDQVAFEVTVVGGTGSVHRVGIYADNGAGYPGALLKDCGTVATASGTGNKTIAVSPTLVLPPGNYWIGVVQQGAPSPAATLRYGAGTMHNPAIGVSSPAGVTGTVYTYDIPSGITGALPDPFTASVTPSTAWPRVWLRGA